MNVRDAYAFAKRVVVTIVGFTVLAIGVAMLVLPGPAFVVIPVGLGILGLEFAWARRWLVKVRAKSEELARAALQRNAAGSGPGGPERP
jgi:tellurite resistance protein TerC